MKLIVMMKTAMTAMVNPATLLSIRRAVSTCSTGCSSLDCCRLTPPPPPPPLMWCQADPLSTTEATLTLDVCTEVYKVKREDKIQFALASTLNLDGSPDNGLFNQSGERTLLDDYEYGMYGRVFEVKYLSKRRVQIYASFGGLLMCLEGEQNQFERLEKDQQLYCLMRKAGG